MADERAKNEISEEIKEEEDTVLEDRLSKLPEGIITRILSLLPTVQAIRMSRLSRRWRRMWTLVHALDFCENREKGYFRNDSRNKFFTFVNWVLLRRDFYRDTNITKFKLHMNFFSSGQRIDDWVSFIVSQNVNDLDLCVVPKWRVLYRLPDFVLTLRSLTLLKLERLLLKTISPIDLPCLVTVHFLDLQLTDEVLSNLLCNSPSLESLRIELCSGLTVPKFQCSKLKHMEFRNNSCRGIKIEAENLESFVYLGDHFDLKECLIFLTPCVKLKNLSLYSNRLTEGWLGCFVLLFPLLESLSLTSCFGLKEIKICSENLKELFIKRDTHHLSDDQSFEPLLSINAPNLVSFTYTGYSVMKLSWLEPPKILSAKIRIYSQLDQNTTYSVEWYTNLIQFLSNLNYCKSVDIFCSDIKALIIPNEVRAIHRCPLPDLECLKVETSPPLYGEAMFRKSLQWLWPNYDSLYLP